MPAAVLLASVLVTGCSDLGDPLRTPPPPEAVCDVLPLTLDLGAVAVGVARDTAFRIVNTGAAPLAADIASSCASLQVLAGGGAHVIAPGETLRVIVRFTPSASGPGGCTVTTGLQCATVDVTANGFVPATVFFATDIQPIFTARCVSCHGNVEPQSDMNLASGHAYSNIVNVVSTGYAPAVRVVPGDPPHSVLDDKVWGLGHYGGQMPEGGTLTTTQKQKIRTWITEGARNN